MYDGRAFEGKQTHRPYTLSLIFAVSGTNDAMASKKANYFTLFKVFGRKISKIAHMTLKGKNKAFAVYVGVCVSEVREGTCAVLYIITQ